MAKKKKRKKARAKAAAASASETAVDDGAAPATATASVTAQPSAAHASTASAVPGRTLGNAVIAAFLVYQLVMPITYYVTGRGPDERFAWRMFSTLRLQKCEIDVFEVRGGVDSKLRLKGEIHVAWHNIMKRMRPAVVEKFLLTRCDAGDVDSVRYVRTCNNVDGDPLPTQEWTRTCETGGLEKKEVPR